MTQRDPLVTKIFFGLVAGILLVAGSIEPVVLLFVGPLGLVVLVWVGYSLYIAGADGDKARGWAVFAVLGVLSAVVGVSIQASAGGTRGSSIGGVYGVFLTGFGLVLLSLAGLFLTSLRYGTYGD